MAKPRRRAEVTRIAFQNRPGRFWAEMAQGQNWLRKKGLGSVEMSEMHAAGAKAQLIRWLLRHD
jgi:hypothetical protein